MVLQGAWQCHLDFFGGKPVVVEPVAQDLSSDAGLLPIRELDEKLGFTEQFAAALDDPRDPDWTQHSFLQMTRSRIFGILAGDEDQNDHSTHEATAEDATESPPPRTVRLFTSFWDRADSWEHPRFTIVTCEANAQGTNRRAIITNRPGAALLPEATYDEYANRGESENRSPRKRE